jgi:hypothetical protein
MPFTHFPDVIYYESAHYSTESNNGESRYSKKHYFELSFVAAC